MSDAKSQKTCEKTGSVRPRKGGRSARVVRDVLAATLEAFIERGYAGLSIEDVAQRAGVNKTTIYRRWPTRADLVGAALLSLRDEEPELPDTGSLRKDLFLLLRQRAALMETPRRRAIKQAVLLSAADPEVQALVSRLRLERPLIPTHIVERAIDRGELPPGTDVNLLIETLLGTLHARTYLRQERATDQFLERLVELVVAGAAAGAGSGEGSALGKSGHASNKR